MGLLLVLHLTHIHLFNHCLCVWFFVFFLTIHTQVGEFKEGFWMPRVAPPPPEGCWMPRVAFTPANIPLVD